MLAPLLLALLACDRTVDCPDGQGIGIDGDCVDYPSGMDVAGAEHLPACTLGAAGTRLDLVAGCADGACNGATFDAIGAALGEEGACTASEGFSRCEWQDGAIASLFVDDDNDAVPDDLAQGIYLRPPWDGTDDHGLGLGQSLACFLEALGPPGEVEYTPVDGEDHLSELWWKDLGLFVDDDEGGGADGDLPDGYAERISLFGAG